MGNVLHVIFRYFIDTQAGVVHVERLLLHKGDANNVLPTALIKSLFTTNNVLLNNCNCFFPDLLDMEVDEAPKEEDVGKTQEPCETSEEEGEAMETGITPPPSLVTELGEHPPEVSQNDGQTSGEEGELSMSEDEGSPQRMAPASPAKVTASKHVSESGKHSELHTSDQLTEGMQAHETGAASGSEHGTPSCEDNRLTNCSTSHSVDKETLSDKTQVDKQCLAKNSSRGSEDHNTSEDTDRNLDANNIDLLASGDNDNVHHDKKCTKPTVTTIDRLSGDVRNEDDKVMAKNEKQRLSKTSLHDEPVELDYEEEGIEDSESLANTGGDDSKELEMGELDEKVCSHLLGSSFQTNIHSCC